MGGGDDTTANMNAGTVSQSLDHHGEFNRLLGRPRDLS